MNVTLALCYSTHIVNLISEYDLHPKNRKCSSDDKRFDKAKGLHDRETAIV